MFPRVLSQGTEKKSANVVVSFLAISFLSIGGSGRVPTGTNLATLESRKSRMTVVPNSIGAVVKGEFAIEEKADTIGRLLGRQHDVGAYDANFIHREREKWKDIGLYHQSC